jgi:PAS domain S-box-containing protein
MFFEWLVRKKYKKKNKDIQDRFESYQKILELTDVFEAHEKKLNSIIELQKEMLCRFLPDTTLTFVNYACCRAFGLIEKEMIGKKFTELTSIKDKENLINAINELTKENPSKTQELQILSNEKKLIWHELSINIILQEDKIIEYQAVGRDITERKEAEEKLNKVLVDYDTLLNNIEIFVWYMIDPETMGAINQSFADFFGFDRKKVIGTKLNDIMCDEVLENCLKINKEIFETGKTIKTEEWVKSKTGEIRLWEITKKPKKNGHVQYIVASAIDITDKKSTEEKYKLLVNQSQTIIYMISSEGIITYISPSCEISLGFKPEEIIGKNYKTFIDVEDFNGCDIFINPKENIINVFEYKIKNKNKEIRYHRTIISPIFDNLNQINYYIGNSIDITDKIKYEKKLKEQNKLLESVLEAQTDYVVRYSCKHEILYANSIYCNLFFDGKVCLGKPVRRDLINSEDVHKLDLYLNKIYKDPSHKAETDIRIKTKNGEYRFFHVRGIGITNEENEVIEIQSVGRDLTCKLELERKLNYRNQLLESVLEAQTDFVVRFDKNKKILYSNNIYRSIFFNNNNCTGSLIPENLVHPEDQDLLKEHFYNIFNPPYKSEKDLRIFNFSKNNYSKYHINTIGIFNENKELIEVQSVGRDITERYELQKKLDHESQLLKSILETQTDCITRCDLNRIVLYANKAYAITFCGRDTVDSCMNIDFMDNVYPDDQEIVKKALEELIEIPPHKIGAEYRVVDYNGNIRFFRWQAQGIVDDCGKVYEIQSISRDVAEIIK